MKVSVTQSCPTRQPYGACQAPLSMRFSRQEYWSGLPFPSRYFPNPGMETRSPALQADSLPEPPGRPPVVLNSELNESICEKQLWCLLVLGREDPWPLLPSHQHVLPLCQPICCYSVFSPITPKTPSVSFTPATST